MKQTLPRILIVDDEAIARENLEHVLRKENYEIVTAGDGLEAIRLLEQTEFDLVITGLRMDRADGMQVLERARELYKGIRVIVMTRYATVSSAIEAMKKGAYHYIPKPYQLDEARIIIGEALEKRRLQREVTEPRSHLQDQARMPFIIGKSPKMQDLLKTIEQVAPADCNIVIVGETGTGKELVARAIHRLSLRAQKRFLAINCAAFTEELLANELFGHEKEAFTGAQRNKIGLLESASGGTVFLDEIGDMPLSMQVKLLRVLQERRLIRVGGTREIPVDLRILAATNKHLEREVEHGRFRRDLYYRLNVITINVPPLVERREDIPRLCRHFMARFSTRQGKRIDTVADEVLAILMHYDFPGNVRELENIVERAVTLSQGESIEVRHLPPDLQRFKPRVVRTGQRPFMTLEEIEKEYILWVLEQVKGNRGKAAQILGIDRSSLWRKIKRYNLDPSP